MTAKLIPWLPLILAATAGAQEKDPFVPEPIPRVVILYEILEVERAAWLQWTGDPQNSLRGPELRAAVRKWQDAGKARVELLGISPHEPGSRSAIQAGREMFIPSQSNGGLPAELEAALKSLPPYPRLFAHFENQTAGFWWSADVNIVEDRALYSLSSDYTAVTREDTFGTGLTESKIPVLAKLQASVSAAETSSGESLLVNVAAPFPGRNPDAVWLSFVRLDRIEVQPFTLPPPRARAAATPGAGTFLVEWIELSQPDWVAISSQPDEALRAAAGKLIAEGKAAVTETAILAGRFNSGHQSSAVEEFTFVSEYEFPRYTADGQLYQHEVGAHYEMRHLGETVHTDTRTQADGTVGVKFAISQTALKGMRPWGAPELKQVYPDFRNVNIATTLSLPPGQSRLVSAQPSIKPANPALEKPRILVFARAQSGAETNPVEPESELPRRTGRFTLRILETTQQRLDAWLSSPGNSAAGSGLYAQIAPEAKLVETASLTMKLEGESSLRSIDELLFPSEYDTCEWITPQKLSPVNPGGFDTRYLGLQMKLDLLATTPSNLLGCKVEADHVSLAGLRTYYKGEATTLFPEFDSHRLEVATFIRPDGAPVWIGATRPPGREAGSDATWAWFLSAEILP